MVTVVCELLLVHEPQIISTHTCIHSCTNNNSQTTVTITYLILFTLYVNWECLEHESQRNLFNNVLGLRRVIVLGCYFLGCRRK